MLENMGVKIIEFAVGNDRILGFSAFVNDVIPLVAVNLSANQTVERKRFTALHELGHLLLNFSEDINEKQRERFCHCFAASVLCPKNVFEKTIGVKRKAFLLDELINIRVRYGMSIAAIVHRAKDLNIITESYYHFLFEHVIRHNIMEKGWGEYPVPEETNRFDCLLKRAVAEGIITMSRAAELANEKLGDYRDRLMVI